MRYVPVESALFVYQPTDVRASSSQKSLRQLVVFDRLTSRTVFGVECDENCDYYLIEEAYDSAFFRDLPPSFVHSIRKSPWVLYSRHPIGAVAGDSEVARWTLGRGFLIVIAFIVSLFVMAFIKGTPRVLLSLSLVSIGMFVCFLSTHVLMRMLVFVVCLATLNLVRRKKEVLGSSDLPDVLSVVVALILMISYCLASLERVLAVPNVASVVGGKAKLIYECGAIPAFFWQSQGCSADMLPWYPPGLSMLVLFLNVLIGSSYSWSVQLLTPAFFVLVAIELLSLTHDKCVRLLMILMLATSTARWVSVGLYSEYVVLLCVMVGLKLLRHQSTRRWGALFLGLASWYKLEGLAFALVAYGWTLRACEGIKKAILEIGLLLMPFCLWLVLLYANGASHLFDVTVTPLSVGLYVQSLEAVAQFVFSDCKIILYLGLAYAMWKLMNGQFHIWAVVLTVLSFFLLFLLSGVVYATDESAVMQWHIETSMPRMFWLWTLVSISYYEMSTSTLTRLPPELTNVRGSKSQNIERASVVS